MKLLLQLRNELSRLIRERREAIAICETLIPLVREKRYPSTAEKAERMLAEIKGETLCSVGDATVEP